LRIRSRLRYASKAVATVPMPSAARIDPETRSMYLATRGRLSHTVAFAAIAASPTR